MWVRYGGVIVAVWVLAGPGPAAADPVTDCYRTAVQAEVGPCLTRRLNAVEAERNRAAAVLRGRMRELADVSDRLDPIVAFEDARRAFENFRAINCNWYYEMLSPDGGALDAQTACRVRLTRDRVTELERLIQAAERPTAPE